MSGLIKALKSNRGLGAYSGTLKTVGYILMGLLALVLITVIFFGNKSLTMFYTQSMEQKINTQKVDNAAIAANSLATVAEADKANAVDVASGKDARRNAIVKLKDKKEVNMLVFGDAVVTGYGLGDDNDKWLKNLTKQLEKKYNFKISTKIYSSFANSVFGSWVDFAGEIEKSDEDFDLIVICHGKNEGKYDYLEFSSAYEELTRRLLKTYPGVQVLIVSENSVYSEDYYQTLQKISNYYGVASADMREAFKNSGKKEETLVSAGGYPNKEGSNIYANTAFKALSLKIDEAKSEKFDFRAPLFGGVGEFQNYYRISAFKGSTGDGNKIERDGKRFVTLAKPGDSIETNIMGSFVGLYALEGPDCGKLKIYVDDFLVNEIDLYAPVEERKRVIVNHKKDYANHVVRIEVSAESNTESSGNNVYIFGVLSNTKANDAN